MATPRPRQPRASRTLKDENVKVKSTTKAAAAPARQPRQSRQPRQARTERSAAPTKSTNTNPALGITKKQTITSYTLHAIKEYGTEVIEQRAIPDYRDGLKPVHRMSIWAAHKLGIYPNHGFKKAAHVVGFALGRLHPHGDQALYQAIVGLTGTKYQGKSEGWYTRNCACPLFEGQGNWGDFIDGAAAYRYTELRLSKFSALYLLDADYLAVMDYVPNYDDSEKVPVVLPAKLPVILLNGYSSIAVGVSAASPPFAFDGVRALAIRALKGEPITAKLCAKTLVPDYPYGGVCVSDSAEVLPVMGGKGSILYQPTYVIDENKHTLTFTSVCPGLMSPGSIETFLNKLAALPEVSTVADDSDKRGPRYEVVAKRGIVGDKFDAMVDRCIQIATRSESYDIGVTLRNVKGGASFELSDVPTILQKWSAWRIEVESKVITRLIEIQRRKIDRLQTMRIAVLNLEIVIQALKVKKEREVIKINGADVEVDGAAAFLVTRLKIRLDQAEMILDLKVRQLRAIEISKLDAQLKVETTELNTLLQDQKAPNLRAVRDLEKLKKEVL